MGRIAGMLIAANKRNRFQSVLPAYHSPPPGVKAALTKPCVTFCLENLLQNKVIAQTSGKVRTNVLCTT